MSQTPQRPARLLRGLADRVLAVPDLEGLTDLLTRELPSAVGAASVTLLVWDHKLDAFWELKPGEARRSLEAGAAVAVPEAHWLLAEGNLIETAGAGSGTRVLLMARTGVVGNLLLGPRRRPRRPPYDPGEVRQLQSLAQRAALALENHLYHQELIASERLAALGTMAGMLAHDFRGPMTVIRGYAELLQDEDVPRHEIVERARLIAEMIDRLERMTTETLDFARGGGRVARRSVALRGFLSLLRAELEAELPGLAVELELTIPEDARASLDQDKVRRAVGNIAANARDAMGGAGRLRLTAELVEAPQRDGAPGGELLLALLVADDGQGVPPSIRERLFEPFVTHGKKGGTGLGLAVARRFVEDHGGTLELLPDGPGARFLIRLPIDEPAVAEGAG